ncbi:MAG: GAF domain-containing sensor histidine kinase [Anaerolineales bacterium]|nr:GAF domain-containing sensor histidine kinase [Anaerolineales bacterium]
MSEQSTRVAQRAGWLAYNLRWLLLVAAVVLVLSSPQPPSALTIVLLAGGAIYNFILTLVEFAEPGRRYLIWTTLMLDFALGLGLYGSTGLADGRLIWIGLLPGLTATLRFQWWGALLTMATFLLLQAGVHLVLASPPGAGLPALLIAAVIMLPLTLAAAFIARQMRLHIERTVFRQYNNETQRSQVLRQHARAIYEMSSMLSATLDYKAVLEAALNFGALGAESASPSSSALVAAVLFFEEDQLHLSSARRLTQADQRVICPGRAGILGEVVRTGEPAVTSDPAHDPELMQFVSFRACQSLMALPLRAGYETYGVVLYGHPLPDFFDDDQRALLVAVVNQSIVALQNAQLYRNLRQEKDRLLEVQDEAQKKLARDLHDGPTQAVAALAMRANYVRRLLERDPKHAGEELFRMEDLARKTTREIRHMLFTLRPLVLESQGLTAALGQLADKLKETHGQNVIVEAEPRLDDRLEMNQQGVLFYIVEEALNNARKHAQAEHLWVRLKTQGDVLTVEVQDDGVGFNVGAVEANYDRRGSLGMVNMRERAEMINGAVRIDSAEGRGTRIVVFVPLTEAAKEHLRV